MTGRYQATEYNIWQEAWLYAKHGRFSYPVGSDIKLNPDSTFIYTTCATIRCGTWENSDDQLFLITKTHEWAVDSIQIHGFNGEWPSITNHPLVFKIKGDYLLGTEEIEIEGKKYKSVERFDKIQQ